MRKKLRLLGFFITIFLLFAGLARTEAVRAGTLADEAGPTVPEAHASITDYTGPETCLMCHPNAGKEVAESVHYQNLGPAPFLVGAEEGKLYGMYSTY